MKSLSIAALLLMASALTPVSAADMTHERSLNVWQNAPELKNTATASMLYVFEQQ